MFYFAKHECSQVVQISQKDQEDGWTLSRHLLDFFDLETWWQRLLQFLSLFLVEHHQCVEVARATDLELGVVLILLYLDGAGILSAGLDEEVFYLLDFLRHFRLK